MKKYLLILLFIYSATEGLARTNQLSIDSLPVMLEKGWKFNTVDDSTMSAINYDDNSWTSSMSIFNNSNAAKIKFDGLGWFRFHFSVDSTLVNIPLALTVEHKGASEIYIDGKLIIKNGEIKDAENTVYFDPNRNPVIIYLTNAGNHVLAIRYANYNLIKDYNFGFSIIIGRADELFATNKLNSVAITFLTVSLGFIFLTLSFLHLCFFLYYRSIKSNLFFSIFMFCAASLFFIILAISVLHNPVAIQKLSMASLILVCITCFSFAAFIHFLFLKKHWFWILAIAILSVLEIIALIVSAEISGLLMLILVASVSVYIIYNIVLSIVKKVKGVWIIGSGILFFIFFLLALIISAFVSGGFELNDSTFIGKILVMMCILAVVSIPLSMSVYQAWEFAQLNKDLSMQLIQVKYLSGITLKQEQEKKEILENQKAELEIKVEERTHELKTEKKKSDDLLRNILPEEVAEELKAKGTADAKQFDDVTVMFTDFKNFTQISEKLSPTELVNEIHCCFKAFDEIISKHTIEKIKTIGDSYMCAGGLPVMNKTNAEDIVKAALEIQAYMNTPRSTDALSNGEVSPSGRFRGAVRIGIHTGPVVAGIVGVKKFAYDIWGDTVNIASRMESSGEAGKINISGSTHELVKDKFTCTHRGKIQAKNKGEIDMYFVES